MTPYEREKLQKQQAEEEALEKEIRALPYEYQEHARAYGIENTRTLMNVSKTNYKSDAQKRAEYAEKYGVDMLNTLDRVSAEMDAKKKAEKEAEQERVWREKSLASLKKDFKTPFWETIMLPVLVKLHSIYKLNDPAGLEVKKITCAFLKEKLGQMDNDCEMMLNKEQQKFAEECFELIMDADGRQESYVYRKGFQDCVAVLKLFGILA